MCIASICAGLCFVEAIKVAIFQVGGGHIEHSALTHILPVGY